jgi:hypothetical protein
VSKTSGTAIRAVLVLAAALLVVWWAWPRPPYEPGAINATVTEPTKNLVPPMTSTATRASAATPAAMLPRLTIASPANTPPTFAEALAKLSPADAEYIKAANKRLYGALDYHSIRELQWKLERGFPTIEQMLALRGQPVPTTLNRKQVDLLPPQDAIKYFLQKAMAEPASSSQGGQLADTWIDLMSEITRRIDTPFPAYLRASITDAHTEWGQKNLVREAMFAVSFGDTVLASEINARLQEINGYGTLDTYPLEQLLFVMNRSANDQVIGCLDRYTGNPRTVELGRQYAEQRRASGICR